MIVTAIIVPELIFLSQQLPEHLLPPTGIWWVWLLLHCRAMTSMLPIFAAAAILFSWRSFRGLLVHEVSSEVEDGSIRAVSVMLHLLAVLGVIAWMERIVLTGRLQEPGGVAWFYAGAGVIALALLSWLRALFPAAFWLRWFRLNPAAFVSALAVAIFARIAGTHAQLMWRPLSASTLSAVAMALRLFGRTTIVGPRPDQIGIPGFRVLVGPSCSGLEGIGLITVFVAGYLWFCRRELRFPISLILLPAGVVAMWIMNVIRITALILIGVWSPTIAVDGFHTVAGWLLYTATAIATVVVSRRSNLFSRFAPEAGEFTAPNPAAVYLAVANNPVDRDAHAHRGQRIRISLLAEGNRRRRGALVVSRSPRGVSTRLVVVGGRYRRVSLCRVDRFAEKYRRRRAGSRVRDGSRPDAHDGSGRMAYLSRARSRRDRTDRRGTGISRIPVAQTDQRGFRESRFRSHHVAVVRRIIDTVRPAASAVARRCNRRDVVRDRDASARQAT